MALAVLTIDINAKLASLEKDMGKAAHIAEQNAKRMEAAFNGAKTALAGIGAALSVGAFASMIKGVADAGDQLAKLSTKTGVAVEELSKLQYAASLSDVSNEELGASLSRLNKVMGEAADGSKEATAALARFGIAPGSMNTLEAFQQIAERVKNTGDATKVASGLTDIFGKSYAQLIPLLKSGAEGLKESGDELERLGGVISGDLAKSSEAFNDNITKLNKSFDTLKIKLGEQIIPSLRQTTDAMVDLTKEGNILLALLRGYAGLGKLPFDMMFGDVDMSATGQLNDLKETLEELQSKREEYNPFVPWGDSLEEIDRKILITKNQIEALTKFGDRIGKATATAQATSPTGPGILGTPAATTGKKSSIKKDDYIDPMTESAKALAQAIADIDKAQQTAIKSTLDLTAAEETLYTLQNSAFWEGMPDTWKQMVEQRAAAAIETERLADSQKKLNAILDGLPSTKIEQTWENMALLGNALDAGKINAEQYQEAVNSLFSDETNSKIEQQKTLAEELGLTFTSAFEDAIVEGEKFSDVLDGLAKDILRLVARKNVTEPLAAAVGSIDWANIFSANALGGVYSSPGLSSYSGSIVNKPTIFPFASGIGLMGEAGAEAILPLKRGSSGALGVQADGLGGINVTINNSMSDQAQVTAQPRMNNGQLELEVMVQRVLSKDMSRNGPITQGLSNTFGMRRSV